MPHLEQKEEKQATVQIAQDTIHLISHQLLNSVTKLQIVSDMWNDPETRSKQFREEALQQILRHEIRFLRRLGQDILQLDQTDGSELSVTLKPINLVKLVKQILPPFQFQEPKRKFETYFEADLPLVWGDTERLQDVLDNLIGNALKYSKPSSPIKISVQRGDGQARVSVTNSGSTIPQDEGERIFAKFYRGRKNRQPGFGLGLYLADHLIRRHGGRIWVESSPAKNTTTFHFTLRLVDQAQSTSAAHGRNHHYTNSPAPKGIMPFYKTEPELDILTQLGSFGGRK